jgi:predicted  nucleic acid-binding Zn-ribbon protein
MPRETLAAQRGKIAALQDQLALSEARHAEERSAVIRARAELTEERKRCEALVQDVRHAEAERNRLQGYIDRVREEQGVRVGEVELRPDQRHYQPWRDREQRMY